MNSSSPVEVKIITRPGNSYSSRSEFGYIGEDDSYYLFGSNDQDHLLEQLAYPSYMHILYEEEPKEGDWVIEIDPSGTIPGFEPKKVDSIILKAYKIHKGYIKIIASSNPTLELPKIPFEFIEEFVKSNGSIRKALVEYNVMYSEIDDWQKMINPIFTSPVLSENNLININTLSRGIRPSQRS